MPGSGSWRAVLEGPEAERALEVCDAIAEALRDPAGAQSSGWDLGRGQAGIALLFTYRALALEDGDRDAEAALACVEQSLEAALEDEIHDPSLYGGIAGIAWTLQHLRGRLLDDENVEVVCEIVDRRLLELLDETPWTADYDLISGLVGYGVYFLERRPSPSANAALERIVAQLAVLARQLDEGVSWFTPAEALPPWQRKLAPEGYYNLGVAHGVPGVIALLARLCDARALGQARPLLEGAVSWLLSQRLPPGAESVFGTCVGPGIPASSSRLAWCYGDLGLATSLLLAARCAGVTAWEREALAIARAAARRRTESAGVVDAALCHGAAGNAHLFNRLFQATGEPELEDAARFWFGQVLSMRKPGVGVGGYQSWAGDPTTEAGGSWEQSPGFLEGAAGVALALLSAASPVEPCWDRVMLASVPVA